METEARGQPKDAIFDKIKLVHGKPKKEKRKPRKKKGELVGAIGGSERGGILIVGERESWEKGKRKKRHKIGKLKKSGKKGRGRRKKKKMKAWE